MTVRDDLTDKMRGTLHRLELAAKKWKPVFCIKHATTKEFRVCCVSIKTQHTLAGLLLGCAALLFSILSLPAHAEAPTAHPAMWVATGPKGTVYMLGSFHLLKPAVVWEDSRIDAAMSASDHIWFEVTDFDDTALAQSMFFKYGLYAAPELSQHLSETQIKDLGAALIRHGMSIDAVQRFKPWAIALVLTQKSATDAGFDPQGGVDITLYHKARTAGKPVAGFETLEQQIKLLAEVDDKDGVSFLDETLKDDAGGVSKLDVMADAWAAGDNDTLTREVVTEMKREEPDLYRRMLYERNMAWLPQVEAMLKAPGTSFVIVGDGHLLGEDGLVARLKADGMSVREVR